MTRTRHQTGFAGLDPVRDWPPTRTTPRPERLERPLDTLPGVGPTIRRRLARLGLETVGDLLAHRPHRYETAVPERRIADLFGEEEVAVAGVVRRVSKRRPRRNLTLVTARVADDSGEIDAVWFNQSWLAERLQPGTQVRLRGHLRRREFSVRSYDLDSVTATADYAPVYPASEEVTPKKLRELVGAALAQARDEGDALPAALKESEGLPLRADAVWALHRPRSLEEAEAGRRRLAFDELLVLQLGIARRGRERALTIAPGLGTPGDLVARYRTVLPFTLTPEQEGAIRELDGDLAGTVPMQRLLQGDVGSGKTVVALYALLRAVEAGRQGALMAPTETLAEQHFLTLETPCVELGVSCVLLTSALRGKEHAAVREAIASGAAQIALGTHALIQEHVSFNDLAVAVVDEQHRFGVEQRQALVEGRAPHVLHMTATPIPRTLALTVYGDLSVSEIARPPANRRPVVTRWVTEERSSEAYTRLRRHLDAGRQAYVVCPLIEESETSVARAAEREAERLSQGELRGYRVGLLHGRLKPVERRELMARFKARELDVLVATTVIEVGVDIPNATIMIVQEADRFGLAQLHQLRGRVGRGAEQSYCLLVSRGREQVTESATTRLEALVRTTDGFELAEVDLELRGEGQLLGTRQAGLSDLRYTRLRADRGLLERAREAAAELVDVEGPLEDEVDRVFGADDPGLVGLTVASGRIGSEGGHDTELDERLRRVDPDSERPWLREGVAALGIRTVRELNDLIDVGRPERAQIDACLVAGSLGDRRSSVPRLVRLLAETDSDGVRVQAAVALSQLGGRRASGLQERVVLIHSEPRAREMAAYGLASGGDHREADFLLDVLNRQDEDPAVRAQAAEGIGNLVDRRRRRRFVPHLVEALADPAPEVRFWACFALSGLGGEAEIPALERLLDDRSVPGTWTWSVRREARWAIECILDYPSAEWPQAGEI